MGNQYSTPPAIVAPISYHHSAIIATPPSNSTSPLLELPAETRELFYRALFQGQKWEVSYRFSNRPSWHSYSPSCITSMLQTCRQINAEATPLFHALVELDYLCSDPLTPKWKSCPRAGPWSMHKVNIMCHRPIYSTSFGVRAFPQVRHLAFDRRRDLFVCLKVAPVNSPEAHSVYESITKTPQVSESISRMTKLMSQMRSSTGIDEGQKQDLSVSITGYIILDTCDVGLVPGMPFKLTMWNDGQITITYELQGKVHELVSRPPAVEA